MSVCEKCAAGAHPFKCFLCEHPGSLEYYRDQATDEELAVPLVFGKICNDHAKDIDKFITAREKEEIQKAVA